MRCPSPATRCPTTPRSHQQFSQFTGVSKVLWVTLNYRPEGLPRNRRATRSVASLAIVAVMGLCAPAAAFAGTTTTTSSTTTTTTVVSNMREYRAAEKNYLEQLKVINQTFEAAVKLAKTNFNVAMAAATNASQRITARAALRLAIANATGQRATSLTQLGKPPSKPRR